MPFTTNRKLSVQTYNSNNNTWGANGTTGSDLNTGVMGPIDSMLGGVSTFTNPSGAVSLDFVDGGGGAVQNAMWRFTGTITATTTVTTAVGDATTYLNGFYCWSNTTSGSFTITLTTTNGSLVLPQGRRGVLFVSNVNSQAPVMVSIVGSGTADPIPAGTVMPFYQNAAPAGWTIVTSQNNKAMRVVSSAGGVAGGTTAFTSVFTSRTPAGSVSAVTVAVPYNNWTLGSPASVNGKLIVSTNNPAFVPAAADQTVTSSTPTFTGTAMDFAVQYIDVILATRD